jgi:hypothetical protein
VAAAARALVGDDDGRKAAAAVGSVTVLGSVGPLSFIVLDQGRYGRPDPPRSASLAVALCPLHGRRHWRFQRQLHVPALFTDA